MSRHRRTNSYSYTASEVQQPPQLTNLPPLPPPSIISASKQSSTVAEGETFHRAVEERRSYKTSRNSLAINKGYRSVNIDQSIPPAIRFSIYSEDTEMYRSRSPTSSKTAKIQDVCVPDLDRALAEIKEQLSMMKQERAGLNNRMSSLQNQINITSQELAKHKTVPHHHSSPGQSLRRIHSLEGSNYRSHSRTSLLSDTIHEVISDTSSVSSMEASPVSHSKLVRRNKSLSQSNSHKCLETIHDTSVLTIDNDSSSDESSPQPSPIALSPYSKLSISPQPNRLPTSNSWFRPPPSPSSGTYDCYTLPSKPSCPDTSDSISSSWSVASSTDSSSMVMQISSATGQLEKVPKVILRTKSPPNIGRSMEQLNNGRSLIRSSRLSVSSYFIGPGYEDDDSMIMKLSEEPAPSRSGSISSVISSPHHRYSMFTFNTNSKETSV